MADDDQTNQQKPEEPAASGPALDPPPPVLQPFSEAQLLKWIGVPEDAIIAGPLRRRDVDNLMVGLFRLADAQTALDATLVLWSNGKPEEANRTLGRFRHLNAEGQNRLRQFLASIIASFPDPL